jgi:hypothetical protein
MIIPQYIEEIPYNQGGRSNCDACAVSFNREYLYRFRVRNMQVKLCFKCKWNLYKLLANSENSHITLQENLELTYQIVEQADTIRTLIEENRQISQMNETLIDIIEGKSK